MDSNTTQAADGNDRCTYCGAEVPAPVELHHHESECVRPAEGGVLQASEDLVDRVERFEREPDGFTIATRVREDFGVKRGTVESRLDNEFPLWPVGVRWDDGSFETCSATELRRVEAVIA